MILLDANVIIDAFDADSPWHEWAMDVIAEAVSGEGAAVDSVALCEAIGDARDRIAAVNAVAGWGVELVSVPPTVAVPAAAAFATYRARCRTDGIPRTERMPLPDFLFGAHAEVTGMSIATRDTARFQTYFPRVTLISPNRSKE